MTPFRVCSLSADQELLISQQTGIGEAFSGAQANILQYKGFVVGEHEFGCALCITYRAKSLFLLNSEILQIDQRDPPCCDCSAGHTPQNESHLHLHLYLQASQFPCKNTQIISKSSCICTKS